MDCHTHVTLTPQVGPAVPAQSSVTKALKSLPVLRTLLMNGFTRSGSDWTATRCYSEPRWVRREATARA
jgi:hypothetical protein